MNWQVDLHLRAGFSDYSGGFYLIQVATSKMKERLLSFFPKPPPTKS
jgi:hypothetical protein